MPEAENTLDQIRVRREKLAALRARGEAYPNDVRQTHHAAELHAAYDDADPDALAREEVRVVVAGRVMAKRVIGKATFVQLQDATGRIQLFFNHGVLGEEAYRAVKHELDLGDLIAAEGPLFFTRTGELSVRVERWRPAVKCLRPLPEKWHGLADVELRHRKRYLDLIVNPEVRETFTKRTRIIAAIRRTLEEAGFIEVETPILQPQPGGAAARPFVTHHNALDIDLYLRIAPELYLKRLLVGGFERVFEIGRNFRNEGVDATHNPEFTMVEFYQAWADFRDAMQLTERVIRNAAEAAGSPQSVFRGVRIDWTKPFARKRLDEAVFEKRPDLKGHAKNKALLATACMQEIPDIKPLPTWKAGHYLVALFEHLVEPYIEQPTFITHYPADVSPLARRDPKDPFFTERFELIAAGREIVNGFSELNDPDDQRERFIEQQKAREAGDLEAAPIDEDFIEALEYGMPPAAGVGIGIDRLVMALTGQDSIREVL
ncbi:MAG: lysine--tRNA ligase, partial [Zetaproteobacteria bacterium]